MRKIKDVKLTLIFGLIATVAVGFALVPSQGIAAQVTDTDGDGLLDTLEQAGITLTGGQRVTPCTGAANEDRHMCLDWQKPDLFVILVRANGCPGTPPTCTGSNAPLGPCQPLFGGRSNIPSMPYATAAYDPWELVELPKTGGGLGITIHEITASQVPSTRVIPGTGVSGIPAQKAVRLTESLNACGTDALGSSSWGTPNTTGTATLYTQRIKNKIDKECAAAPSNCFDDSEEPNEAGLKLYYLYIQNLLVHELGHVMALTKLWTPEYGGPHEVSGSRFIMEQKPVVKIISGGSPSVKWYISADYSGPSKSDFKLK
jgi:hypothetical protein